MKKLFDITFQGTEQLLKLAEERANLLRKNVESAVYDTMLLGIARIGNDAPVDTGRLQGSITGEYADQAGVDLKGEGVEEGKALSVTGFNADAMEARVGTNVEYALYQEYGAAGKEIGSTGRSGAKVYGRGVRGKGFFRNNIPILKRHFNQVMENAIQKTSEGKLLRKGN